MTKLMVIVSLLAAVGCATKTKPGGGSDNRSGSAGAVAASCKPLAVTIDGQPQPALKNGLAHTRNANGVTYTTVEIFNHDKATCADVISADRMNIPNGEMSVHATVGDNGKTSVGIDGTKFVDGPVKLLGAPKAVGEIVKLCADGTTFTPEKGPYQGKTIVISGLFEGPHCGELKL